jgi:hypothetical protein
MTQNLELVGGTLIIRDFLFILDWAAPVNSSREPSSPKGCTIVADGNALGVVPQIFPSP